MEGGVLLFDHPPLKFIRQKRVLKNEKLNP